eukprot:1410051-Rhodomonas_salina.1
MLGITCVTLANNYHIRSQLLGAEISTPLICASLGIEVNGWDCLCRVHGPQQIFHQDKKIGEFLQFPIGLLGTTAVTQQNVIRERLGNGLLLLPMSEEAVYSLLQALQKLMRLADADWRDGVNKAKYVQSQHESNCRIGMAMQAAKLAWKIINSFPVE